MYRHAALIVCVTPAFVDNLAARGVPRAKLEMVPNGVDLDFWQQPADGAGWRARHGLPAGGVIVSYVGTVGMAHGLGTLLAAAGQLKDSRPDVTFLVVGDGAERQSLEERARREGLANVRFVGQVPRDEVRDVMAASDISLVLLRDEALFRTVLPTKMLEGMAAGRPVVLGVRGQALEILEASGGGLGVAPEDAGALALAVRSLADSPEHRATLGQAGRAFVAREYDRRAWARRYEELLRGRLGGAERSSATMDAP
jgi:glycosyltransferase involved in cell wall biosynthesis